MSANVSDICLECQGNCGCKRNENKCQDDSAHSSQSTPPSKPLTRSQTRISGGSDDLCSLPKPNSPDSTGTTSGESGGDSDGKPGLSSQASITTAIKSYGSGWLGKDLFVSSTNGERNRNVFDILCIDVDEDPITARDLSDIFAGPEPLYPVSNPLMHPYVISVKEMECRIRTLEKHMILDLPAIYLSTDKDVLKDESTFSLCDGPLKKAIHHLGTVMDQATEFERQLLRNVCTYYAQLHQILGDPTVHEFAYEDLFRSFCQLADVELHNGSTFTRHMEVLGKEVRVTPDFRITSKKIMVMNQVPYMESTQVIAVVELKKTGQWAEPFKIHPRRRPWGFKLTANMRGQLLAEMVADLEISRCHGSKSKPNGLPLCIVGVSVFSTKICFSFLEFPVKQYNEMTTANSNELTASYRRAYRKRFGEEAQCERAVLKVSECFDMTRKEDRAEILNILYLLGNVLE